MIRTENHGLKSVKGHVNRGSEIPTAKCSTKSSKSPHDQSDVTVTILYWNMDTLKIEDPHHPKTPE